MRRLNGLDTMFVSVESNRVPTHVTCVTIVDPATSREPYTLERIQESLAARLDLLAPFRRRLVRDIRIARMQALRKADHERVRVAYRERDRVPTLAELPDE